MCDVSNALSFRLVDGLDAFEKRVNRRFLAVKLNHERRHKSSLCKFNTYLGFK